MSSPENDKKVDKPVSKPDVAKEGEPEWTTGLRRLYDSVLDEPMPDAFADLLAKLDKDGGR
ncbi:NepR family anti-sigma factor [Aurantiacibacter luteus]|uniref:Anti-sigma factor NepR domain-containing protein n=1 Tax=Aurantiacibacter luteus TaxID=1581420 RepID=A0A0G9MTD9_9SPHN|nr:NepR family anti-sigma factor [Aurantiacibacter luteus]KLE33976.1 hypothetical protein AAW00_06560 [Aurantiacibacter luteus]